MRLAGTRSEQFSVTTPAPTCPTVARSVLIEDVATGERCRFACDWPIEVGQPVVIDGRRRITAGQSPRDGVERSGRATLGRMSDHADLAESFLALVDEAFRRLLDGPDAHLHVTGFAEGDVAFVFTRDGLEVRRQTEAYGLEN